MTTRLLLPAFLLPLLAAASLNTKCDVSPQALTDQHGVQIPQSCIEVGDTKRCYYTYIPECAHGETPVVYDIHGYNVCPRSFSTYSGWFERATEECFVVVWPTGKIDSDDADAPCWSMPGGLVIGESEDVTASCCCQKNNEPVEDAEGDTSDLDFLRQMAFYLVRDVPSITDSRVAIDTKRIYMSGHGNGCMLANSMAARHSDLVAAVACMAGVSITSLSSIYEPVPTWTVAGALDDVIPTSGSRLPSGRVQFPGQQASFQYLSGAHACTNVYNNSTAIHEMDLPEYPLAGTMHVQTSFGCSNGAIVQHVTIVTGGHLIYKGTEETHPATAADTSVDTTSMAWGFMISFARSHEPIIELKIDLNEIKDLLHGEENEQKESTSHVLPPAQPQNDTEDDVQSPWSGLRGPGISEEQALVS